MGREGEADSPPKTGKTRAGQRAAFQPDAFCKHQITFWLSRRDSLTKPAPSFSVALCKGTNTFRGDWFATGVFCRRGFNL